ncbi:S1 family peptidase [Pseudofrankia asymbiotica]|uniref:S1 family peptidase n=1 Tax=Pseudofrankia asymbiotica TaxID=1834516 RepID=UPI0013045DE3|nr:S1 family peptidase [Pseudofrankia asymbiotica]
MVTLPAQAAPDSTPSPSAPARPGDRGTAGPTTEVVAALQRDLGLTEQQAKDRLAQQANAIELDGQVRGKLGSSFGGSWFDPQTGRLVVGVTSEAGAGEATRLGAQPKVVARSYGALESIVADLDTLAGRAPAKAGSRAATGKPQAAVKGVSGWHIDPVTNTVVVSVVKDRFSPEAQDNLTKYGDAVRVEYLPAEPTTTANFIDGGDQIDGASCSAGFNLRNPSTGKGYLLTAGHCVSQNQTVTGQGGFTFGTVRSRWFPSFDDSLTEATNPGYWIQGPWIDTNPSNGGFINVSGYTDAPVGTYICKSGITTRLTCGNITGKDETVLFDGVNTVYGLTRHSACVEPGDSGGANYVPGGVNRAEGVTSGAVLYGATRRCGSAVGQPTISWYFPIADSLAYYGPAFGVSLW